MILAILCNTIFLRYILLSFLCHSQENGRINPILIIVEGSEKSEPNIKHDSFILQLKILGVRCTH
jgi:hypothetical protein